MILRGPGRSYQLLQSVAKQNESYYLLLQFFCFSTFIVTIFTARCTLVQSAVLRSHVVCPSVCDVGALVDCDQISWNSSEMISPLVSLGCSLSADPNIRYSKGNTQKFWPKVKLGHD